MKNVHALPRGVERVILPTNNISDNIALNKIVHETTRRLATEGKRVSLPPKRLYVLSSFSRRHSSSDAIVSSEDGIAIDWYVMTGLLGRCSTKIA